MAPPTHTSGMEFEVFLSFRGPDTRRHFTSCLYREMVEKGIRVFKDDEELRVGQKIDGKLLEVLDASQIYIPIFSKGFASSPWCLREVAHMVDCTSKSDGNKQILPVFFDVEPDDVKLKTVLYRDALSKHEEKYGPDEVKPWEDALVEVPTRVGWKLEGKEFGELIGSIVREVQLKLKVKHQSLPNHLVKVDDQEAIEELLDVDSDGVRFVIIHGTGGVGKSTLAKVIFNQFLSKFSYSSFLEDVQDLSQRHGLLYVQKKLLSDTLGLTSADKIHDTNEGINRIRKGLSNKKVMVVVDNVNEKKQLENLAGDYKWFGSGSRIIVTVRDKRTIPYMTTVDEENPMRPSHYLDYPVKEMPSDQAILLFSKHAFRSDMPPEDWCNFSEEVVSSIGRLPLTLEVVGSLFAKTDRSKWHKTLKDLKQVPREEVRRTLMTSFNKLDRQKKEIFLDISCFCIGENITNASYMWEDCGYSPHSAIEDLLLMSLIKIDEYNTFRMHDELRDLGRYIVKQKKFEDAGNRRWVWIDENTLDILRSNKKKPAVRALSLGIKLRLRPEELSLFPMLRFLGGENMEFVGNFKKILPNLRWLSWRHHFFDWSPYANDFPDWNEPPYLVNLVVLDLSLGNVIDGWHGWSKITMALKVLDLTRCMQLTKTPNFSKFSKLEKLILAFCENLSTIDGSIGKLELLSTLNIEGCKSLRGLPKEIGSLKCLSEIIMPTGDKPFKLPKTLGNLKSLTKFEIRFHSGISVLPHSIGRLTNVTHLSLHECKNLHELPNSIGKLEALVELDLQSSDICFLPDSIGNLKRLKVLRVRHTRIRTIPGAIGGMEMLQVLDASFCTHLMDEIPWEEWSLTRLRTLDLDWTPIATVPTKISGFSSLQTLRIASHRLCLLPELPLSLKCLVVEAAQFPVLPDLSSLVHLHHLEVRKEQGMTFWIPNEVTSPWKDAQSINRLPLSLSTLKLHSIPQLPDFSDFQSLSVLSISGCLTPCLPDISCLKSLQELQLSEFPELVEIPGLGELESLIFLHIKMCDSIEQLPNLWKLKNLRHLELKHCAKLRAVEGLKELNSLKNAEIKQCMSLERLPDVPAFTKLDTNWSPPKVAESTIQSTMPRKRLRLSILEDK